MINKNLKLMVLGLASFGMVACGGGNKPQSSAPASNPSTPASQPTEDLPPVVEGKITVYFEFKASEGVSSLETWTSPFIDGDFNGWDSNPGVELTRWNESNLYYAQIETDWDSIPNDRGYQLCLGYNDASGVGDSLKGVASYSYKSDYCSTFAGLAHPVMTAPVDGRIKLTGDGVEYQTWSKQPVQPIILENYHVYFDASEITEAPEYVTGALIKGSFNGWDSVALRNPTDEEIAANADIEGKLVADMGDVFANTPIEFCIGPSTAAITGVEDEYRWESTTQKLADGNMSVKPLRMDGNNAYVPYSSKLVLPTDYVWPSEPEKLGKDITVTLENSGTAGLAEGVNPALIGLDGNWTKDIAFELVDDSYQATIPGENRYVGSTMEFKVRNAGSWTGSAGAEGGNISLKVLANVNKMTITLDFAKLGVEEQVATVDYHAAIIEGLKIVLVDTSEEEGTIATTPYVAGTVNEWQHEVMTQDEEGNWTYECTGTYYAEEVVSFKITNGSWSGVEVFDAETNGNFNVTLIEGANTIYVGFGFAEFTGATPGGVMYGAL